MSTTQASTATGTRVLDEETLEVVRRRIGIPIRRSVRHHNEVSSTDSFRHFAAAYGDDNPLYSDPAYASASRWGTPIAPPLYPYSAGVMRRVKWTADDESAMAGGDPLRGIGQYMCGERWLFVKPIRPGDVLLRSQSLFSAELKRSSFGGGTGALLSHEVSWDDEQGSPYALRYLDYWHADRDKSRQTGKYRDRERPTYTDEDIERIDAMYESATVQGAKPRLAGDVKAGDSLGPIVKGPMSVTDIVCWHAGTGMGEFGVAALGLGYKNRRRVPAFYQKNDQGFWDAAMRAHWDQSWAERLGQPAPYDYGFMRTNWMVHLITSWMGDDAWIWKLSSSVRKFNHMGDVHEISGVVREVDRSANTVTIDVVEVNQRGETTCDGWVVVVLPGADGGTAALPRFQPEDVPEATAP